MVKGSDDVLESAGWLIFCSIMFFFLFLQISSKERSSALKDLIELDKLGAVEAAQKKKIKLPIIEKISIKLEQAGIKIGIPAVFLINCMVMFAAFLLGSFFLDSTLGLVTSLFGPWVIWMNVNGRIEKRGSTMLTDFRDLLNYTASSIGAGTPLHIALEKAAKKIKDPLSKEILDIIKNIRGGMPIDKALREGMNHIPLEEYKTMVMACEINLTIGGNLGKIFEKIASDIDKRIERKAGMRAATAQGKQTAKIVSIIPFVVVGAVKVLSPGFYDPVLEDPQLKITYIAAICIIIFGVRQIHKMINNFAKEAA
jgi:tight adherence protein B